MMKKITLLLLVLTVALSACSASPDVPVSSEPTTPEEVVGAEPSAPTESPIGYLPKPDDAFLTRAEAYIDSRELVTLESYPLQFMLSLKGNTPTPCHQLRVSVNPPDAENKILVEVYSVTDPTTICAEMLSPFEVNVPLGSFAPGYYILLINGEQAAEFEA